MDLIQLIVLSCVLILSLLILNAFLNSICGLGTAGEYGKILEGSLTIAILYLFIIELFGSGLELKGIPFVDILDSYKSLTEIFKNEFGVFVVECAELISLTFMISLISYVIPRSWGGAGFTGEIIRSIVVALLGLIANNYFLTLAQKTIFFSWAIIALQCFFSGTSLLLTPAMLLGKLLKLNPESGVVAFLVKKLPQTKIGKSISVATTNSLVLIFIIMIFESQFGSSISILQKVPVAISLFAPIVIMLIGIRLMIKSL